MAYAGFFNRPYRGIGEFHLYYVADYRHWLQDLPAEVTEGVAYRNGLDLFQIEYQRRSDLRLKN